MPKISVITPVYNGAKYIGLALDSLLAQTFADWESIIVDDGSTDATPQILKQYHDPRACVISQSNGGEAVARNTGLDASRGEYIAFLDADDLYLPNALADMAGYLDAHPEYEAIFCDGFICDEAGNNTGRLTDVRPGIHTGFILEALVNSPGVITFPICTLTRRAAITRHNLSFDRNLVIGPDWDFWIQLARFEPFGYLDSITCKYRVHETNITRTSGWRKRKNDLIYGRVKVMESPWFNDLSVETRKLFFYNLLIDLMESQPGRQQMALQSQACRSLPQEEQASLWRQVGIQALLSRQVSDSAVDFFRQAYILDPYNRKTRYLLKISVLFPVAARASVKLWQASHQAAKQLKSLGQHRPKNLPANLRPIGD